MDRSKRATKKPIRFDDEAYVTPPRHAAHTPKSADIAKPTPEPTPTKNIIKVKLAKVKPREITPKPKEPIKSKDLLKPKIEPTDDSTLDAAIVPEEPKIDETIIKQETPAKSEEQTKVAEPTPKPNHTPRPVGRPKREYRKREHTDVTKIKEPKLNETPKHKDSVPSKSEFRTPDKDVQLVYRPKTRRPRTPPVYADLIPNVVLPFWDARTAAEDHEDDNVKELVHCHCGVTEELGLMVQCETCLTWQHAHCLGIDRPEDAPDGYTCKACSDPKFARESMKWAYDQDWLTKGRMKQFPCDPNPIPEKNVDILNRINLLIADALNIHQMLHSLRVKNRILMNASDDDPELKLFRVQWPSNYKHRDGTNFIPTINNPSSTPASTISVIADAPDPGDIAVDTVVDAALPDIGHMEDVSAILDTNPYVSNQPIQPMDTSSQELTPDDCRANLRLHIQQTEEFIGIELAQIEEQLASLEKDCTSVKDGVRFETSLDSLKNDLHTMRKYISITKQCEN